jgi:hypothetical protein
MGVPPVVCKEIPNLSTANSGAPASHVRSTVHSNADSFSNVSVQVSVAMLDSSSPVSVTDVDVLLSLQPEPPHVGTIAPDPLEPDDGTTSDDPPFLAPGPTCNGSETFTQLT